MTEPGISVAWMAESYPARAEDSSMLWYDLANTLGWRRWLVTHIEPLDVFSVVYFEDRDHTRMVVRGDGLSYYVSASSLYEADSDGTLDAFMQQVFFDVYLKWADKRDLPRPPTDIRVAPRTK